MTLVPAKEKLPVEATDAGIRVRDTSQIIDKLYDAVVDLDLWPEVIRNIADAVGAAGSALLSNTQGRGVWVRVDPAARTLFEQRFISRNPMHAYVSRARAKREYRPSVITEHDIAAQIDIRHTEYFNEFLVPFDGPVSLAFDLGVSAKGTTAALNLSRTARKGAFEDAHIEAARTLHPHLMRAFWLSLKLAEKQRTRGGAFSLVEHATFAVMLLDAGGMIVHANAAAERMLRERNGLRVEGRNLCALRSDNTATLQRIITGAAIERKGGNCTISRPMRLPLSVTVTPISDDNTGFFEMMPSAIVCAFDPTMPQSFSTKHLQEMFGLSGAEARVGVKLLEGLDQKEVAAALGVSFFTVRAHLSQIFQKTHTNRQAEFVSLAMRAVNPRLFGAMQ